MANGGSPHPGNDGARGSGLIILIESDARSRRLYTELLESRGYMVFAAEDGSDGLLLLGQHVPEVVLINVGLSDMDGFEVCRRAREVLGPNVPIVFLSPVVGVDTLQLCLDAGGDDLLMRGGDMQAFLDRMRHWSRTLHQGQRRKRLEHVAEAMQDRAVRQDADGPLRATDPAFDGIMKLLDRGLAGAGDAFGANGAEQLYLLGYAAGVIRYQGKKHKVARNNATYYLRAALRETGRFDEGKLERLIAGWSTLTAQQPFKNAFDKGLFEAMSTHNGRSFAPVALASFSSRHGLWAPLEELHERVAGGGASPAAG